MKHLEYLLYISGCILGAFITVLVLSKLQLL